MEELKNQIEELNKRIEYLEKKELKRTRKKQIEIALQVLKITIILVIIFTVYTNVNKKLIKPYKEKIDYVEEKVNNVETFVHEKWESLKNIIPFNNKKVEN